MSPGLRDAVPSHNDEAEVATLGAVLIDTEALPAIIQLVRPEDFYKGAHQRIYEAVIGSVQPRALDRPDHAHGRAARPGHPGALRRLRLHLAAHLGGSYERERRVLRAHRAGREHPPHPCPGLPGDHRPGARRGIPRSASSWRRRRGGSSRFPTGTRPAPTLPAKEIVKQTFDAIEKHYHSKTEYTGIPSGFKDLDQLTMGFQNSEFIVIGARPSVGKTAFALTIAANMAIRQKIPVGFFSLEMSSMAIMQRLLSMEARLDSQRMRTGMLSPADFSRITEACCTLYEAPLYISDSPDLKLLDLRAQARRMKSNQDVKIIFVDYITLIGSENRDLPRHEQIAEVSRSLKASGPGAEHPRHRPLPGAQGDRGEEADPRRPAGIGLHRAGRRRGDLHPHRGYEVLRARDLGGKAAKRPYR